ncbi:AP-3 complex subunit beta-2-like [Corticium candelabrum]|uniref:AP-3 complex subunit beta-2-like n=1 Tax=Corticium candelabrum TaxID=121492 RepID=UPI002E26DA0F|nr:AP-3 complex subunit beta-2-like [Corticium candelabrum]
MSLRDKIVLSLCLVHSGLKMRWTIKQRTFTADYLHLNPEVVRRRLVKAVEHCEEISSDSEVDKPKEDKVLLHVAVLSRNPTRSWLLENRPDLQMEGKAWLVAGSAVVAFEEVCPERIDLIHKNYRKLCNLLVDVEDWGQVAIISMLTRYAHSQFANPNVEGQELGEEKFYSSENEGSSGSDIKDKDETAKQDSETKRKKPYVMDPDHRLLLQSTKPLLQSRNTAVVMSVAQLYFHAAPAGEMSLVVRPLIRLLRTHR